MRLINFTSSKTPFITRKIIKHLLLKTKPIQSTSKINQGLSKDYLRARLIFKAYFAWSGNLLLSIKDTFEGGKDGIHSDILTRG